MELVPSWMAGAVEVDGGGDSPMKDGEGSEYGDRHRSGMGPTAIDWAVVGDDQGWRWVERVASAGRRNGFGQGPLGR